MIVAVVVFAFFAGFGMGMIYALLRVRKPLRHLLEKEEES